MAEIRTEPQMEEAVCLALYGAMNATLQLYRDLLAPWGLSYQQLMLLGVLWEEGETTPGRLAQALMLDSSTITGLLSRLQKAGLIDRATDPADRRRVRVTATDYSRQIAGELGWLEDCLTRAIALDPQEAHELVGRLHELRKTITDFPRPTTDPANHAVAATP